MTSPKAEAFLSELEKAAKEATSGPWTLKQSAHCTTPNESCRAIWGPFFQEKIGNCIPILDAKFIVKANPSTILALLADRKALIEALEEIGCNETFHKLDCVRCRTLHESWSRMAELAEGLK